MQDNKYKVELLNLAKHIRPRVKHIVNSEDYRDFKGFTEKEVWNMIESDDLAKYEAWLKEL